MTSVGYLKDKEWQRIALEKDVSVQVTIDKGYFRV